MIEKILLEYHQLLDKAFHSLFVEAISQKGGEQLHPLRVNVKKQLAFFNLLAMLDQEFPLKSVCKPARAFMRQTSALRDAQAIAELAQACEQRLLLPNRFSKRIKTEKKSRLKAAFRPGKKFSPAMMEQAAMTVVERLNHLSDRVDLWPTLHRYFHEQTDLVRRIGERALLYRKNEEVHRFRKAIRVDV